MTTTVPTLTDGPVRLRALDEGDLQGCYEQCVDPLSVRWTSVPVPFTLDDAREYCLEIAPAGWADDSQWLFAVEVEGRYAGNIALRNRGPGRAAVAFGSHPWVRGAGHMSTAIRMLLDWGFAARGVEAVEWTANLGNWASRKTAWRLGFTFVGTLPSWGEHRGELVDSWIAILRRGDPREPRNRWLDTPVLETDGLRLRPVTDDDVPRVVEAAHDPRTRHWLSRTPSPYGQAEAMAWLESIREQQATGQGTTWTITEPDSDLLLGTIDIFGLHERSDCEIGYWTHPEARGRGVMTRAVRIVIDHAFTDLAVQQVHATSGLDNAASRHLIESVGLRQNGVARRGTRTADGPADAATYDVLATEWLSLRR